MKRTLSAAVLILLVTISFFAGSWYQKKKVMSSSAAHKILYYVDPMNAALRSDKPGIAPCGMPFQPVYANDPSGPRMPAGTVSVSLEKQQLIGVTTAIVQKAASNQTIRVLGRVVPDETRIYRINSASDGWVKRVLPFTTGSLVKKDELLATFYSPDFFPAIKAYLYGLRALDRFSASEKETQGQIEVTNANIDSYRVSLRNLGMSEHQIDEMTRTRQGADNIEIRAPEPGYILARNISIGQRFERGTELYRVADLSHVWILGDVFENEVQYLRPGISAAVTIPAVNRTLQARVSDVLPQFDPASRTLKVRLEADNPDLLLRPDMFVDVKLDVRLPASIAVPADAIIDSGLKKTVFVEYGKGAFQPRTVETGWRFGDRVEIVRGLVPGERIAVSGNFLIDSESRMQMAASGMSGAPATDPSCGHTVDRSKAKAAGRVSEFRGATYYFCSAECKEKFDNNPGRALARTPGASVTAVMGPDGPRHD